MVEAQRQNAWLSTLKVERFWDAHAEGPPIGEPLLMDRTHESGYYDSGLQHVCQFPGIAWDGTQPYLCCEVPSQVLTQISPLQSAHFALTTLPGIDHACELIMNSLGQGHYQQQAWIHLIWQGCVLAWRGWIARWTQMQSRKHCTAGCRMMRQDLKSARLLPHRGTC